MFRGMTNEEITALLAKAAPADGGQWSAVTIAEVLANYALDEKAEEDAWQAGRAAWEVQLTPSGVQHGNPARVLAMQDSAEARVLQAVEQKIASNKALITMVGTVALSMATAAMGGAALPTLIPQAMGAATQIAAAMNGPDKEPPTA